MRNIDRIFGVFIVALLVLFANTVYADMGEHDRSGDDTVSIAYITSASDILVPALSEPATNKGNVFVGGLNISFGHKFNFNYSESRFDISYLRWSYYDPQGVKKLFDVERLPLSLSLRQHTGELLPRTYLFIQPGIEAALSKMTASEEGFRKIRSSKNADPDKDLYDGKYSWQVGAFIGAGAYFQIFRDISLTVDGRYHYSVYDSSYRLDYHRPGYYTVQV